MKKIGLLFILLLNSSGIWAYSKICSGGFVKVQPQGELLYSYNPFSSMPNMWCSIYLTVQERRYIKRSLSQYSDDAAITQDLINRIPRPAFASMRKLQNTTKEVLKIFMDQHKAVGDVRLNLRLNKV